MMNLSKDLRYAFRTLTKNPGFAIIGILTLALGMAVNTTLFSVVNGFILRPLPVPHPEHITVLALQQSSVSGSTHFSHAAFDDLRSQTDSFSDLFAYTVTLGNLAADHSVDHVLINRVSNNYFSELGVQPSLGRLILPSEGLTPGADPVIVLSYSYWRKRFSSDPNVVGEKIKFNNLPFTIIGVAPSDFHGTYSVLDMDGYIPFSAQYTDSSTNPVQDQWTSRDVRQLTLMGRLKPGVSIKQAQASLNVIAQRIASAHPDAEKGMGIQLYPEKLARPEPDPTNSIPAAAAAFMVLAGIVLLVACFNIANVLLVRATVRQREMAIRAALGAGRYRLVSQYLTESLLLAVLGGGLGLLLGSWAAGVLGSVNLGTELPYHFDFHPDSRVYSFALAAVLLTGLIVGIMPALRAARTNVISVLHEGGRGSSSGPRRQFARNALVVAQVAGSLVLLVVAGLFVRSLSAAQKISLGFNPDHVLNLSIDLEQIGYKEDRARQVYPEIDARIRALPGVQSVAEALIVPMGYVSAQSRVWTQEHPLEAGQQPPTIMYNKVTPSYFDALQIPLRGRSLSTADSEKAPQVAVINQFMAKKLWPNEDAIAKHFSMKSPTGPFMEVVGVTQDGKYQNIDEEPQPFFYRPLDQEYTSPRTIQVRASVPPETLALQIESQIRQIAPDVPITQVQTMNQSLQGGNGYFFYHFGAQVTAILGVLGLILAVVGIYSVVSYAAAQRTQEIGIRIAMGASPLDILKMVLRQGLSVVALGLAIGLAIALAGTRLLTDLIVGIKPTDPLTFSVVVALLAAIALFACWVPARRATRIDPLIALRYE